MVRLLDVLVTLFDALACKISRIPATAGPEKDHGVYMKSIRVVFAFLFASVLTLSPLLAKADGKSDFIQQVSGVWTTSSGLFLIGQAQNGELIFADTSSIMRFKAVPAEYNASQDYLNVRVSVIGANTPPMQWTLRRNWKNNHKSFSLVLITNTGDQIPMGYARDLSADDMKVINIGVKPAPQVAATPQVAQAKPTATKQPVQTQDVCAAAEE